MSDDSKPHPLPSKAPDFTKKPWAHAHRKQRSQEKTHVHPKGGGKRTR
jgi:hypothetical protein